MARILNFSDGFTSSEEPTLGSFSPANKLQSFVDDAAFLTYKGSAVAESDVYFNSTLDAIRIYNGTDWVNVVATDASGNVELQNLIVQGDLTVNGTTTTLNTVNLEVEDTNITVNNGGNDASANGAGLTVERTGTNGSLVYDSTKTSKWKAGDVGSESELATVSDSQTLTNKTLTSPVINSPTGIVKADVGLSNVDNTSDSDKNSAAATLTNKTLTTPVINSPTGLVKADVGLSNVDNTSDSAKNAATVVLTNKDIDGGTASNTSRITLPKAAKTTLDALTRKAGTIVFDTTTSKPYFDDGSSLQLIGSGSAGAKNFINAGDAEGGSIWATYKDTASANPVDGTGGIPSIASATTSATSPLSGTYSFHLTHPASNVQGEGWSVDFTIDAASKAKVLQLSFDYIVDSGTFVAGTPSSNSDVTVWIYDVTNATLIQPSSYKLLSNSTSIADHFSATFQTASNSTSYRLIIHCATASASSFVLKLDSVSVSPSQYVFGTPITDWQSYTPTLSTGVLGTGGQQAYRWRRVGSNMEIMFHYEPSVVGTTGSGSYLFTVPGNYSIDTTQISTGNSNLGTAYLYNGSSNETMGFVVYNSATTIGLKYATSSTAMGTVGSANFPLATAGTRIHFLASLPILGWSSSVQMSDSTDTRVVSFSGEKSGGTQAVTGNATDITFAAAKDTHGGWSGSTYVIKVPGDYVVSSTVYSVASVANVILFKNGVVFTGLLNSPANTYTSGSTLMHGLVVGDVLSLRAAASITIANDANIRFGISRVSGPSAIAASESVNVSYAYAAGGSIGTSETLQTFGAKEIDSHGAFNGTVFTAPIAGVYSVRATILTQGITLSTSQAVTLVLYKNGAGYRTIGLSRGNGATTIAYFVDGSDLIRLNTGETLSIYSASSVATAQTTAGGYNKIQIVRVGN